MCKKMSVLASRVSNVLSVIPTCRVLWLVGFALVWTLTVPSSTVVAAVPGVDDPSDMADLNGDIKRIEAWVEDDNLNLKLTVYGVFAPGAQDMAAGMSNRYYYHWILDTDNNAATGYNNSEYEGNATNVKTPIGVDVVVQFGWRDSNTNGVYAYDPLTEDALFEDYAYTIVGDTIHAVIPLDLLGLAPGQVIAVSVFQEGASNSWQVDWAESFELTLKDTSGQAANPIPATEGSDIERDVILGWDSGAFAVTHNLYLGTNWADVNNASTGEPLGVLLSQDLSDSSLDAGRLEFNQTYFWRVDEVNGAPDYTVFKGETWSFTTEFLALPIENVTATASSSENNMGPEQSVNGAGLNEQDQHSTLASDMWLSGMGDAIPWIQCEFDKAYKLHELLIWNSNQLIEAFLGLGSKDVIIEHSLDGASWTALEGATLINQATGTADYTANTSIEFAGVMAQYVKITVNTGWGLLPQHGISELRFMYIPTFARNPEPADAGMADAADVTLAWRAGREAAAHEVYLGTDPAELALVGTSDETSHAVSGLNYATTYYWSVTEVNDAEVVPAYAGDVWSFTTPDFGVVDNFDQYDDRCARIFFAWEDGLGHNGGEDVENCEVPASNGNGGGSVVGNAQAPFAETRTVNADSEQSMPLSYDNAFGPSETTLTLDGQDWTASEVQTLSLFVYGQENNSGQLYIKVNNSKVLYEGDITAAQWQKWDIDLTPLDGLQNVTTLAIGVDGGSAAGMVYIDDIRLYP
jgi:hypothetical protein